MRLVRFRLSGDTRQVDAIIAAVQAIDQVDRVEEVADQMHARDDTSSLGLADGEGPDFHDIEVHTTSPAAAEHVRNRIEVTARDVDAAVEFVDRF